MMKKLLWALMLALAVTALMAPALAEGKETTPSDMYEHEENDGHTHFVNCANPNVCYRCGASVTVDSDHIDHRNTKYVPYNETSHRLQCTECGVVQAAFEDNHIANCDNAGVCHVCGWAGKIDRIEHDERIVGDSAGHYMMCSRCGKISSRQAHWANCDSKTGAGKCERCGEPFDGPVRHFRGKNAVRYDAVYHWFKCEGCGKEIQEKHYNGSYYWYEHEDAPNIACSGCGMTLRQASYGTPGKTPSGSADDPVAGDPPASPADGELTAAILHGNTEGLPMALVYAPRTGKATLRERASADSDALRTLKDGAVVIVLEKGNQFTQVRVDGQVGYIMTGALEWIDPDQHPLGEGMLIYPTTGGRGTTTVNVRCDPSTRALKIDQWVTGTTVLVWSVSDNGNWYEIEYDGVRGYVQAKYLSVTALYDDTETVETEEAAEAD